MELQILDISLSKVDPLTIQKIDDKTLKKIKYLDVINDDWVKKQSIASVLKQRDKMLSERCSFSEWTGCLLHERNVGNAP